MALAVVAALALALNVGYFYRNLTTYGNPVTPVGSSATINLRFSPGVLASNSLRNAMLHFGTRSARLNEFAYHRIVDIHRAFGLDPNDARTTFPATQFEPVWMNFNEENIGSPVHVLAFVISLCLLISGSSGRNTTVAKYAAAIVAAIALFCLILRWQPWHARLHLEILVLAAPIVGYTFTTPRLRRALSAVVAPLMIANAVPALLLNPERPLVRHRPVYAFPRDERYFAEIRRFFPEYRAATNYLAGSRCRQVGLWIGWNDWEYPLWALLRESTASPIEIHHIQVDNPSARLGTAVDRSRTPCAIVVVNNWGERSNFRLPSNFRQAWQQDSIRIYLSRDAAQ